MRCAWTLIVAAFCVGLFWYGSAHGQAIPAPPAVPAAPVAAPAAVATPATPQPFSIWSCLCPPPGCCEKCKKRCCESMFGQLIGSMLRPVRLMTGGLWKPHCPTPDMANPEDLKKAADTPAGAAARIKQEEAEAKARRADVRYLGTVDCNRYPEAEKALIKALRTDRNECVRFEAALALGNGCCCTKGTVEALLLTVNCSDSDGNPVETSPRVRNAASFALAQCEGRGVGFAPEPVEKPLPVPEPKRLPPPAPAPVAVANSGYAPEVEGAPVPTGQRGLFQIFMRRAQAP